mmetsp:Transcript_33899/g.74146  ORF Transcript_33899/g.74146 Transcript_33899/m.74146 type:complete len:263 (-) Transcript_33899:2884-3672(-)
MRGRNHLVKHSLLLILDSLLLPSIGFPLLMLWGHYSVNTSSNELSAVCTTVCGMHITLRLACTCSVWCHVPQCSCWSPPASPGMPDCCSALACPQALSSTFMTSSPPLAMVTTGPKVVAATCASSCTLALIPSQRTLSLGSMPPADVESFLRTSISGGRGPPFSSRSAKVLEASTKSSAPAVSSWFARATCGPNKWYLGMVFPTSPPMHFDACRPMRIRKGGRFWPKGNTLLVATCMPNASFTMASASSGVASSSTLPAIAQ